MGWVGDFSTVVLRGSPGKPVRNVCGQKLAFIEMIRIRHLEQGRIQDYFKRVQSLGKSCKIRSSLFMFIVYVIIVIIIIMHMHV